jgi:hypothetical protein
LLGSIASCALKELGLDAAAILAALSGQHVRLQLVTSQREVSWNLHVMGLAQCRLQTLSASVILASQLS